MSDKIIMTEEEARKLVGVYGVQEYREWSDEYRIMHKIAAPYSLPPTHSGARISHYLSSHAARKLSESCEYVACKRGGFTTFLTLTFDSEARERLSNGGTIQAEVSRFFDGLQKMYQRGWVAKTDLHKVNIAGHDDKLDYLWVAENPDSFIDLQTGEVRGNPHVHVLLRWSVPYEIFKPWAARVEKLWGQGFAHLEKLRSKKRESAAAYLMKALQYIAKAAGGSDQGIIHGNRYGISQAARAPGWVSVKSFAWHVAGQLIERARMKQNRLRKPIEQKRDKLKEQLKAAETKKQKNAIEKALQRAREKLEAVKGSIYYGRNRVICQGEESLKKLYDWMQSKGFEEFKKPLSIYAAALKRKLDKKDEYQRRWEAHTIRLGWENDIPDWWAAVAKHRELAANYAWF